MPAENRDDSRLMYLPRTPGRAPGEKPDGGVTHHVFRDLDRLLLPGDLLVFNRTRVIPARLTGEKEGAGGRVETLLLRDLGHDCWECLVRPGRRLPPGTRVLYERKESRRNGRSDGRIRLAGEVLERTPEGGRIIRFELAAGDGVNGSAAIQGADDGAGNGGGVGGRGADGGFMAALELFGEMPLPPYITEKPDRPERYQTVYAETPGSVAAPTAGLHFTPALLDRLKNRGVETADLLLHVGLGTFRPVSAERVEDHVMHREYYELTETAAGQVNRALEERRRVIAVGTTSVRTLEACADGGRVRAGSGRTGIFIYPGYEFQIVDGMITNFHLPKSTLLMLVCAMAGRERVLAAYREAAARGYRFFSFGDAMLTV